jgi:hypothetical protein
MSPMNSGARAKIMIKIGELSSRLGAMERRMGAIDPNSRPVLEIGIGAIRRELSDLSRQLR